MKSSVCPGLAGARAGQQRCSEHLAERRSPQSPPVSGDPTGNDEYLDAYHRTRAAALMAHM
jgi:hypothetical protein